VVVVPALTIAAVATAAPSSTDNGRALRSNTGVASIEETADSAGLVTAVRLAHTPIEPVTVVADSLGMRSCVNTDDTWCAPFTTLVAGDTVTPVCFLTTEASPTSDPPVDAIEYLLVTRGDGTEGFVERAGLDVSGPLPHCGTVPRVRAGLAAVDRIGEVYARPTDAQYYAALDWGRVYGEWSGDCKKLAASAWRDAGVVLVTGHAAATFDWYWYRRTDRGVGRIAPYGSLVGFAVSLPYGHIAVSIGGNRIVTTLGAEGSRTANGVRTTDLYGGYRGWVLP